VETGRVQTGNKCLDLYINYNCIPNLYDNIILFKYLIDTILITHDLT